MNEQNPLKVTLHNNIYQCLVCEDFKKIERFPKSEYNYVYFVLHTYGMNNNPQTGLLEPAATPKPVCPKCFVTLDLDEKASPIIMPTMKLPDDLKRKEQ